MQVRERKVAAKSDRERNGVCEGGKKNQQSKNKRKAGLKSQDERKRLGPTNGKKNKVGTQ